MKAGKLLILGFFLMLSKATLSQTKTYYHNNPFERTWTKCDNPPMFGKDSLDLQKYLADKLKDQIASTSGEIQISLLIDTTGKILCRSIDNHSNLDLNKIKLNLLFDSMPNWNCGSQRGHKVDCIEQVVMTFNNKTLEVVYRIGNY